MKKPAFLTKPWFLAGIIIPLAAILVYANTLTAPFVFDDEHSITSNPAIRQWPSLKPLWEFAPNRFITFITLALNYRISRLIVVDYHLTNLFIHILSGFAVFSLCLTLLKALSLRKIKPEKTEPSSSSAHQDSPIALFAALLFITHPLQTQAVTYIIQRAASLAALFYLASMAFYAKAALFASLPIPQTLPRPQKNSKKQPLTPNPSIELRTSTSKPWYLFFAWLCGLCAMFSKENALTLPIAILLMDIFFFSNSAKQFKHHVLRLIPFLALLFVIPLTMLLTKKAELGEIGRLAAETQTISRFDYLFTQINVIRTYLRLLVAPYAQNLDYDYPIVTTLWNAPTLLSLLLVLFLLALGIYLFRRHRLASFGIFFFFLALAVESSIFPIADVIFEHRVYLPLFGFALIAASLLYAMLSFILRHKPNPILSKTYCTIAFLCILALSLTAHRRNAVWRSEESLWTDVVKKSPNKARGHNNLGAVYLEKNRYGQAAAEYRKAIALYPNHLNSHVNLAFALSSLNRPEEALQSAQHALQIQPDYSPAYHAMAKIHLRQNKPEEAFRDFAKALELNPNYMEARYDWANALSRMRRYTEAIPHFQAVLESRPEYLPARANYSLALLYAGRVDEALSQAELTVAQNPRFPLGHLAMGRALLQLNRPSEAKQHLQTLLQLDPKNQEAQALLRQINEHN